MEKVKFIYADLQKPGDVENSISLTTLGTTQDLKRHGIELKEGETHWFWRDDELNDPLIFKGKVRFNKELNIWIVDYDPKSIKHLSESEFANSYSPGEIQNG